MTDGPDLNSDLCNQELGSPADLGMELKDTSSGKPGWLPTTSTPSKDK